MKTAIALTLSLLLTSGLRSAGAEQEQATFAGGCFWCIEAPFEKYPGVISAVSDTPAGTEEDPTYKQVSSGRTSHIEAVLITYDPEQVGYEELINHFWRQFDPTDQGGSFYDRGHQYTSAVFYHDDEQKRIAEATRAALDSSGRFDKPVVTPIRPAGHLLCGRGVPPGLLLGKIPAITRGYPHRLGPRPASSPGSGVTIRPHPRSRGKSSSSRFFQAFRGGAAAEARLPCSSR